jgi:3-hydroxymyristoyl/3-hydroxydecanoyl-(acyl carrier protein) dehydratase
VLTLPEIDSLERTSQGLRLHFVVPPELPYFDGHFAEAPLLPGVVQIGWALELARLHGVSPAGPDLQGCRALNAVKFTRVIQPGASVWLSLQADAAGRELAFEYRQGDELCSTGRILFQ